MISLAEARALIAEKISPLPAVAAPLAGAAGRVLRQDVRAQEDLPGFDRSAMDGYALAADDPSEKFRIVAEIQPGEPPKCKLRRGECARIFTGAPIPVGASQVLMQENARVEGGFMVPLERGGASHIRRRGEDARKGDALLKTGTRLGAGELALLAGLGIPRVKVSPAVRVVHFATGNELAAPGRKLRPGQIRDSNSTLVAALVRQFGGALARQERVRDDFEVLQRKTRALKSSYDLLLLSGGASVGDYDFGKELLSALGFQIHFTAVNLRPGKPLVFGNRGRQAAFVLPGNPVSHLVTLHTAVRLAFEKFSGAAISWPLVKVPLAEALACRPTGRETFWPARMEIRRPRSEARKLPGVRKPNRISDCGPSDFGLSAGAGGLVVRALRWQSSGDVTGLAGVNALLQLDANAEAPKAGDSVSVWMLEIP
jgi:molybdopterin molybdotransferase